MNEKEKLEFDEWLEEQMEPEIMRIVIREVYENPDADLTEEEKDAILENAAKIDADIERQLEPEILRVVIREIYEDENGRLTESRENTIVMNHPTPNKLVETLYDRMQMYFYNGYDKKSATKRPPSTYIDVTYRYKYLQRDEKGIYNLKHNERRTEILSKL